jgi:ABC-2 type transport system permease protein
MKAIYKRELRAYFQSVIGWLFCAATLFCVSLYFVSANLLSGYSNIAYALSSGAFLFLFSVPILTMRILAEERKQKTDQLILTAPIPVWKIVVGKYLAMATVFICAVVVVCFYPIIMSFFGTVNMAEAYVAVFGYTLYGLAGIAVGMFISSITESQVVAMVLSFVAMFITYMMSGITSMISSTGNIATKILNCFDFGSRMEDFYNGVLSVTDTVYYFTVIGLGIFFTIQSIQKRRYTISTKKLKAGAYSSTMIVIVTVAAVFFNLMVSELPDSVKSIDMTSNKLYSITQDTEDFLAQLSEDITIYVLASESNHDTNVEKTLNKYQEISSHIKVEYKDPSVYPAFASGYSDSSVSSGSLIVEGSKRSKVLDYNELYQTEFDYNTYQSTVTGYDVEGQVTSALSYVTGDNNTKIYAITGHGEADVTENFTGSLTKANVEVESLNLISEESIPEDAQAILIMSPQSDYSTEDAQKVKDYLNNGGNALVTVGWVEGSMDNFKGILAEYGLNVGTEVVMETSAGNYAQNNPFYLLPTISSTEITSTVSGNYYIFAPYSVGITVNSEDENNNITTLLSTSESSYGKADIQNASSYEKEEGDVDGPFYLGASSERTIDDKTSTVIVYSCDSIFTDEADNMVSGANKELFKSSVNSIVTADVSVSIPVKEYAASYLTVPQLQIVTIGLITVLVIPLVLLIAGIVITVRRRKK